MYLIMKLVAAEARVAYKHMDSMSMRVSQQ